MGAGAARPRGDTTGAVRALSAVRATPSADRPRLPAETEARLAPIEAQAAARYSALELLCHRFRQLAARLREAVPLVDDTPPAAAGAARHEDPQLVSHLDTLRAKVALPPR